MSHEIILTSHQTIAGAVFLTVISRKLLKNPWNWFLFSCFAWTIEKEEKEKLKQKVEKFWNEFDNVETVRKFKGRNGMELKFKLLVF